MAIRNEFEFRSALLTALGQEHTEAEAKNEDTWRRKMLDGLGVEYNQNDVNQFGLFREKLIEGVTNYSGGGSGGGGSSDFSTAEVTLSTEGDLGSLPIASIIDDNIATNVPFFIESFEAILYKGSQVCDTSEIVGTITVSGDAVYDSDEQTITITGDCTITIS